MPLGINAGQGTAGSNVVPINSYGSLHGQLYSPTTFDIRHKFTISGTYNLPGRKGFAQMLEGWSLNGAAVIQTGSPWHLADTTTDFAGTGEQLGNSSASEGGQWDFFGTPSDFTPHNNYDNVTPGPTGVPGVPYYPGTSNASCHLPRRSDGSAGRGFANEPGLLRTRQLHPDSSALRRVRNRAIQPVV